MERYFSLDFSYSDILSFLSLYHNIEMSSRHLRRLLSDLGRRRRVYSDLDIVIDAVETEISETGNNLGCRAMRDRLLRRYNLSATRETVGTILRELYPDAVQMRIQRRLHRREYHSHKLHLAY